MEFYDILKTRRSIRKYKTDPVDRAVLDRVLEGGLVAPSWCNRQCWRYIVVSDPILRKHIGSVIDNPSEACYINAPYTLVLCADPSDSGHSNSKDYYLVDCGISMQQVVLAAHNEGLATCWVGSFPETPLHNLLGIPEYVRVVAISPLGYADEQPEPTQRRPREQSVFEDKWVY